MRIISQNGCDYPYESIAISYGDGIIYARPISNMDKRYLIAKYSTQEKAEKAMQKLHDRYEYIWECTNGFDVYHKIDTIVFRFLQDDEL